MLWSYLLFLSESMQDCYNWKQHVDALRHEPSKGFPNTSRGHNQGSCSWRQEKDVPASGSLMNIQSLFKMLNGFTMKTKEEIGFSQDVPNNHLRLGLFSKFVYFVRTIIQNHLQRQLILYSQSIIFLRINGD